MDSISQLALGAALGVAVVGRKAGVGKAALWGAVAGTLPDLDVFWDHGDPISNMVLHRAESHSLLWLSLFSLPMAAFVARMHSQWPLWRHWWLAIGLTLVTHPLLDWMTVYGTQLALPFTNQPYAIGSIFIVDPFYTLPLLVGVVWASVVKTKSYAGVGLRANQFGLTISTLYLFWGLAAQAHVTRIAKSDLVKKGVDFSHVLVTPTPFNSLLWRVVAISDDQYLEGFYSVFDTQASIVFDYFPRGKELSKRVESNTGLRQIRAFSQGFYKVHEESGKVLVTDLRMGIEPNYVFSFALAHSASTNTPFKMLDKPIQWSKNPDIAKTLPWLWSRMRGQFQPAPR